MGYEDDDEQDDELDVALRAIFPDVSKLRESGRGESVYPDAEGRWQLATHLAYAALVGPIPEGRRVALTCPTPDCLNPAHMYLVLATRRWRRDHSPDSLIPPHPRDAQP